MSYKKSSVSSTIADARASISDYSQRPITAGRNIGGFGLKQQNLYTQQQQQSQQQQEYNQLVYNQQQQEKKNASLLNPSRPMTAAQNNRSQNVFVGNNFDEQPQPSFQQLQPTQQSSIRPTTGYRRPIVPSSRISISTKDISSTSSDDTKSYSKDAQPSQSQQRRPQTATTRSLPNTYTNEISTLLSSANLLATSWLIKKENDNIPHKDDKDQVIQLYKRAGYLMQNVTQPSELVKLCRLVLLLPFEAECRDVFVSSCLKLFELSRKSTNDVYFHQESLFEPLLVVLSHAQMYQFEEVSYVLGCIRNLAVDATAQVIITRNGGIAAVGNLLKEEVYEALIQDNETREKVLIEVTGVLRNLAVVKKSQKDFSGVVELLCGLMFHYPMNASLMLNVARIVSKLSLHQFCRAAISSYPPNIEVLLQLLAIHDTNLPLAVRVCFILGNLTVSNDENRKRIGLEFSGAAITLSILDLAVYRDGDLSGKLSKLSADGKLPLNQENDDEEDEDEEEAARIAAEAMDEFDEEDNEQKQKKVKALSMQFKDNEDLLVKLIRLIGNMGINPNVGAVLSRHPTASVLIDLLSVKSARVSECEELVLNIVATITNLSFYQHENNVFYANHKHIQRFLLPLLFSENPEMIMESVRALGNFSRDPEFRTDMLQTRGDEAMIILLDHSDLQIVFAVCGVLVNLSSDPIHRHTITQTNSLFKLLDVLERGSISLPEPSALSVLTVVTKVFINLCLDAPISQNNEHSVDEADDEILASGTSQLVAVRPMWLTAELHEKLFLQLHDILGQLPSDIESLKDFISKEGRSAEWEELVKEVVSVCTSLLDLVGEPESLHDTFNAQDVAGGLEALDMEEDDEDLFGDRDDNDDQGEVEDIDYVDHDEDEDSN